MQNMINAVKGSALGVAEYFTPVLKVINRKDVIMFRKLRPSKGSDLFHF